MRPNNRQRPRGGRNGGGGGGGGGGGNGPHHSKPQHHNNANRPPNRNQLFDSSGPDVRVRGNAHQVFDKYQSLAREASTSGDRILAESYWQYAEHYFRMIQTMGIGGGFGNRNNQGWGESPEDGSQAPQQGQNGPQQANGNGEAQQNGQNGGHQQDGQQQDGRPQEGRQQEGRQHEGRQQESRQQDGRQRDEPRRDDRPQGGHQRNDRNANGTNASQQGGREPEPEQEPGLGGVAFLQTGRGAAAVDRDPAADEQPEIPEFPVGRRS